jgi:rare lipoprotein A
MNKIIAILFILIIAGCSSNQTKTGDLASPESFSYQKPTTPPLVLASSQTTPRIPAKSFVETELKKLTAQTPEIQSVAKEELAKNDSLLARLTKYIKTGVASWYGPGFHGKKTATGEVFNMYEMTAAHKTLPIPSYAEITNLSNNKTVIVKINDRGPYAGHRLLDLSYAAAKKLGIKDSGTGRVEVKAISPIEALPYIQQKAEKQNKKVYLQIGSFGSHKNAMKLHDKIAAHHLPKPVILASGKSKSTHYKVEMGPINSKKKAEELSYHLAKLGIKDPQIVTETRQN